MSSPNIQITDELEGKFVTVFILGGPGAGKGTQCAKLAKKYDNIVTLSTGALLRQFVKSGTKEANEIAEQMRQGKLVDINATEQLLKPELIKHQRQSTDKLLFIMDGFPRDLQILNDWFNCMQDEAFVPFMIEFVCDSQTLKDRLLSRQNNETVARQDNNVKAIENRIKLFENQTQEVISEFKKLDKYEPINATFCQDKVFESLCELLEPILNEINCNENKMGNKCGMMSRIDSLSQNMNAIDLESKENPFEISEDSDTDTDSNESATCTTAVISSDIDVDRDSQSQQSDSMTNCNIEWDLQSYEQIKDQLKPMFVIL